MWVTEGLFLFGVTTWTYANMAGTCFCWYQGSPYAYEPILWLAIGMKLINHVSSTWKCLPCFHLGYWSQQLPDICFLLVWCNSLANMIVACPPIPRYLFHSFWMFSTIGKHILLGSNTTHNAQIALKVGRSHRMGCFLGLLMGGCHTRYQRYEVEIVIQLIFFFILQSHPIEMILLDI